MLTPVWRKRDWTCGRNQQWVHRDFAVSGHPHWLLKLFPQWINLSVRVCSSTGNNITFLNLLWWNSVSNWKLQESLKVTVKVFIPRIFVLLNHILQAAAYIFFRSHVSPTPTSLKQDIKVLKRYSENCELYVSLKCVVYVGIHTKLLWWWMFDYKLNY